MPLGWKARSVKATFRGCRVWSRSVEAIEFVADGVGSERRERSFQKKRPRMTLIMRIQENVTLGVGLSRHVTDNVTDVLEKTSVKPCLSRCHG
jgi:hypothetical protein